MKACSAPWNYAWITTDVNSTQSTNLHGCLLQKHIVA
jgi:hypothetical protein